MSRLSAWLREFWVNRQEGALKRGTGFCVSSLVPCVGMLFEMQVIFSEKLTSKLDTLALAFTHGDACMYASILRVLIRTAADNLTFFALLSASRSLSSPVCAVFPVGTSGNVTVTNTRNQPTGKPYDLSRQPGGDLPREQQVCLCGTPIVRGVHQGSQPQRHPLHGPGSCFGLLCSSCCFGLRKRKWPRQEVGTALSFVFNTVSSEFVTSVGVCTM